ncbi:LLM class flavin-dependent oxidoreductase, partial [Janibacter hoylei]|nr:LLM class flavin-dependent oxidoreductase [Janibacter hoylei]
PTYPQGLEVFVDTVVPILQQRGLFRTEYTGTTLREHYGLARPSAGHIATTTTSSKEQAA